VDQLQDEWPAGDDALRSRKIKGSKDQGGAAGCQLPARVRAPRLASELLRPRLDAPGLAAGSPDRRYCQNARWISI